MSDCWLFLVTGSYWQVIKRSQVVSGGCVSMNHRNMLVSGPHGHQAPGTTHCDLPHIPRGRNYDGCVNCQLSCCWCGQWSWYHIGNLLFLSYYELLKNIYINLVMSNNYNLSNPKALRAAKTWSCQRWRDCYIFDIDIMWCLILLDLSLLYGFFCNYIIYNVLNCSIISNNLKVIIGK